MATVTSLTLLHDSPFIKLVDRHDFHLQDRAGDTNLIHAVKGGHRGVVEALLKKYADVDITGKVSFSLPKSNLQFQIAILSTYFILNDLRI
jgi:hypothetical protein